jgi:hypothetical protein
VPPHRRLCRLRFGRCLGQGERRIRD